MNWRGQWTGNHVLAGFALLLFSSCLSPPWVGSFRPWSGALKFVEGLRCEMTADEIAAHARKFPPLLLHRPDERDDLLVAAKGDTLVHLKLEGSRLKTYQVSWTSGLTKQSSRLKTDLCTGQKLVELHIISDRTHAGAIVFLDGQPVGELARIGNKVLDVPIGAHSLELRMPGGGSWRTELNYDETSPGHHRLPVPEDALLPAGAVDSNL